MNDKILTWYAPSNNGAFQKMTEYGIMGDLLTIKPNLSFNYTSFNYIEQSNKYDIDGEPMSEEQKIEILNYINNYEFPSQYYINTRCGKYLGYLTSTDYVTNKYIEYVFINKSMTEDEFNLKYSDILNQRDEARKIINQIESEYS